MFKSTNNQATVNHAPRKEDIKLKVRDAADKVQKTTEKVNDKLGTASLFVFGTWVLSTAVKRLTK